jgi:hypothetical protein
MTSHAICSEGARKSISPCTAQRIAPAVLTAARQQCRTHP